MARERVTEDRTYVGLTWENTWGVYAWCKLVFDLTVSMWKDGSRLWLKCVIKPTSFNYRGNETQPGADGYVNIGALVWNIPAQVRNGGPSTDTNDEQVAWATHKSQLGISNTNLIIGFAVRDAYGGTQYAVTEGITVGQTREFWYDITDDFDPYGSITIVNLPISFSTRFRNERADDPTQKVHEYDSDHNVIPLSNTVNEAYGSQVVPIANVFKYNPWARRISGRWMSCNRVGGTNSRRKSGTWVGDSPVLWNNELNPYVSSDNDGYRRIGGVWKPSVRIGDES